MYYCCMFLSCCAFPYKPVEEEFDTKKGEIKITIIIQYFIIKYKITLNLYSALIVILAMFIYILSIILRCRLPGTKIENYVINS